MFQTRGGAPNHSRTIGGVRQTETWAAQPSPRIQSPGLSSLYQHEPGTMPSTCWWPRDWIANQAVFSEDRGSRGHNTPSSLTHTELVHISLVHEGMRNSQWAEVRRRTQGMRVADTSPHRTSLLSTVFTARYQKRISAIP
ncbi:hypothetical protein O6H91_19G049200 [Diphasiastrum complanatum]|uniref:Uncharacterized protein n=1 Tax=Diphasiastrum complanatum TaxID=34168 RepID=A0ACC2AV05_DIPCM|nr:hypothetical protein O6H91_19G049200 [Diphasiastrum complanatum]